ncbi:hypothetical protein RHECNPAF_17000113 [Rhizobium etli CNPAF512]|nr:hypothetical protein RHECNPAF_17000113 [Rhizobium etli CNPAF512]
MPRDIASRIRLPRAMSWVIKNPPVVAIKLAITKSFRSTNISYFLWKGTAKPSTGQPGEISRLRPVGLLLNRQHIRRDGYVADTHQRHARDRSTGFR